MSKFIKTTSAKYAHTNWPIRGSELMEALGVNPIGCKWPDAGVAATHVQGVRVWVEPKAHAERYNRSGRLIRALCECPDCGKVMASVWKTDTE